jgi:hypothetical protein
MTGVFHNSFVIYRISHKSDFSHKSYVDVVSVNKFMNKISSIGYAVMQLLLINKIALVCLFRCLKCVRFPPHLDACHEDSLLA